VLPSLHPSQLRPPISSLGTAPQNKFLCQPAIPHHETRPRQDKKTLLPSLHHEHTTPQQQCESLQSPVISPAPAICDEDIVIEGLKYSI